MNANTNAAIILTLLRSQLKLATIFIFLITSIASASTFPEGDTPCIHCHSTQIQEFIKSVHFNNNISCIDCHGGQANMTGTVSIDAMANMTKLSKENDIYVCAKCHSNVTSQYKQSVHWNEFEKGVTIAATCTDCHSNHDILSSKDPNSSTNPANIPLLCANCHENQTKMQAWYYGIQTDRFDTYKQSFHYKSLLLGNKGVATCPDCHENHDTRAESDPKSTIYPANLPSTCGKQDCHPGQDVLIRGKVHEGLSINLFNIDVKRYVTYFYILMIIFELSFTLGLIGLGITSKYDIKRRE
jgi:nitrate/TMAO reductase-like tetraheme cytochrome c subunit